jgi:hypothetical protein
MFRLRHLTVAGFVAAGGALASTGCVDNDSSLYVAGVFDLTTSRCIAEPDADSVFLSHGVIDVAFARGYTAALLVGSQLTERGSREKLRTETSRLAVEGAHVTLYGTNGSETSFDTAANGVIDPASGTDPGLGSVFVQMIRNEDVGDPVSGNYGAVGPPGEAVVRVRVFGTTLGGQEVESGDFDFSILVCEGCLITYPPEANIATDTDASDYICSTAADLAIPATEFCYLGQDQPIPCTQCASFSDVCDTPDNNPAYTGG